MLLDLALTLLAAHAPEDTRSALARLASDSGAERVDAERWLATNLSAADLTLVAEAATSGAIEVRARLIHALGSDQRHFELAVLLTLDREPVVRRMGRESIEIMAGQWFGNSELNPRADTDVQDALRGHFLGSYSVRPLEHDLGELIDLLARTGPPALGTSIEGGQLALAIDPLLYAEPPDSAARANDSAGAGELLTGSFDDVLFGVIRSRGARIQGFGFEGEHPWLCIAHAPDVGKTSGIELLVRWCREEIEYAERPRGAGAARALAACGWPATLAWLEKRWVSTHDRNALSGLLLAASRGRVSSALCTSEAVTQLVALADEAFASSDTRGPELARDVADALARMPSISLRGEDLSAPLLAGWSKASALGRVLRANVCAGWGRADERWRAGVQAELARKDGALDGGTRLAYLRALALTASSAAAPQPWSLAPSAALLERVVRDRGAGQFLAWTRRAGARPPQIWSTPAELAGLGSGEHALLIAWWNALDDGADIAARLALASLAGDRSPLALGDALAARTALGERARVQRLCARLSELGDASQRPAIQRVALLAGALSKDQSEQLVKTLLETEKRSAEDLTLLGAALGSELDDETVERVINVLVAEVSRSLAASSNGGEPWIDACERAAAGLRTRGALDASGKFAEALRRAFRGHVNHPLWWPGREGRWPAAPGPAAIVSLEAQDAPWPR